MPTPILHEGHLYVVNDQGFAMCMEAATGKSIYRERTLEGAGGGRRGGGKPFYASPVLVNGHLICVSRKSGAFIIPASTTYKKVRINVFASDDSQFNATPAVAGDRLLLRSEKALYCVSKKK